MRNDQNPHIFLYTYIGKFTTGFIVIRVEGAKSRTTPIFFGLSNWKMELVFNDMEQW